MSLDALHTMLMGDQHSVVELRLMRRQTKAEYTVCVCVSVSVSVSVLYLCVCVCVCVFVCVCVCVNILTLFTHVQNVGCDDRTYRLVLKSKKFKRHFLWRQANSVR